MINSIQGFVRNIFQDKLHHAKNEWHLLSLHKKTIIEKAIFYSLFFLGIYFVLTFLFWWVQPSHIPNNWNGTFDWDIVLFLLLSYAFLYRILYEVFSWNIFRGIKVPAYIPPKDGHKVAFLTAFVPGSEPYSLLEKTLRAMVENSYKHDTWLLDEGNDPIVQAMCKRLGVFHFSRKGYSHYNLNHGKFKAKTKGGNYNAWFDQFGDMYEYVAQIDVDFVPHKSFLTRTLGYFEDPTVGFVGTPQVYGNSNENWIARGASEQTYGFYGPIQKGLFGKGMTLFIGANHIVRTKAHLDVDGYAGHITEDHLTGIKYYAKKWKSVYVPEILAVGEAPTTWDSFFSQQMRWAYGSIDILFRESYKHFIKGKLGWRKFIRFLLLEHFYFYGLIQVIGIFLILLYFVFGIESANIRFDELLLYYLPVLIMQFVFFFWSQQHYIDPKYESGLGMRARILTIASWPIFFIALISALFKKRLTYKVTQKGEGKQYPVTLSLFTPHAILGTITYIGMLIGIVNGHTSPILFFFAFLNTVFMYSFVLMAVHSNLFYVVPKLPTKIKTFLDQAIIVKGKFINRLLKKKTIEIHPVYRYIEEYLI